MTKNFAELKKVTNPQIREAKLALSKINKKKSTLRHILVNMQNTKNKGKILQQKENTDYLVRTDN